MFVALHALPLVVVLIGLATLRGWIRAIPPDRLLVIWCAIALAAKQALFMFGARLDLHVAAIAGIAVTAAAPVVLIAGVPHARWRAVLAWSAVMIATILMTADAVYFAWFGDVVPAVAWMALPQAETLRGSVADLLTESDVWNFADVIAAVPLVYSAWRRPASPRLWPRASIVKVAGGVVLLVLAAVAVRRVANDPTLITQRFSNLSLVEEIGPLPFHLVDAGIAAERSLVTRLASEQTFEALVQWLEERAPRRAGTGPWFGAAAGKNLIVIQVESLQAAMVGLKIHGQPVMPNLQALSGEAITFSDVIDQTGEGRTSDAEWIMMTSQLPEPYGAAAFVDQGNHVVGLPSVLASKGYDSLSAVAFAPSFWNRRVMHDNVGFLQNYFAPDFTDGEHVGWGLNDRDFLRQMAPRLAAAREPFAAWLITLSLHYPFEKFPAGLEILKIGDFEGTPFGNYVHAMHLFDTALGEFLESLRHEGLLDSSVLIVTGDHSAGLRWQPDVAHALGFANDMVHWTMAERVPLVIRVPGGGHLEVTRPVGQVDFAPTVLGLLGIDAAALPYVGRNQLGEPGNEPVIRRKGSWVDAAHLFLLRGDGHGSHCYDRNTLQDVDLSECMNGGAPLALRKALLPRAISQFDLQQRLLARLSADAAAHHMRSTSAPAK